MTTDFVFTSGSVTQGHPDKLCDIISDSIVDACLQQDPASRVSTECALSGGVLFISHRANSEATVDLAETARQILQQVGYNDGEFNAEDCSVMISETRIDAELAPRLELANMSAQAVQQITAANQLTLFGYACRQTESLMPLPLVMAHDLVRRMDRLLQEQQPPYLTPDGQAHVGVAYRNRRPVGIHSITLIAAQTDKKQATLKRLRDDLMQAAIEPVIEHYAMTPVDKARLIINPEGIVHPSGPSRHSGLTGRKTGIDTYGEYARNNSAALSGKDPLRIDRSGAYIARHAAKQVVAAGLAEECELQLSYALGQAQPISLRVHCYGTGRIDDAQIGDRLLRLFDFRPGMIARDYELQELPRQRQGLYRELACYGQVGRSDLDLPWERLDRLDALQA